MFIKSAPSVHSHKVNALVIPAYSLRLIVAACVIATISGCMTVPVAIAPIDNPDADLMSKIAASAERVSLAMQRLSMIRGGGQAEASQDYKVPAGLEKTMSINWAGPIDGLARKVAQMSGYTYDEPLGPIPNTPVIVSMAVTGQSMFNILSDAGGQAGSAADIVVRPESRRITVKYPPVTRSGGYGLQTEVTARKAPVATAVTALVQIPLPAETLKGMDQLITIDWTGPIEGLAKKVAEMSGYRYEPSEGVKPKKDISVAVNAKNQTALNILTNAGGQAGAAADIVVDPEGKKVFIKYAPATL